MEDLKIEQCEPILYCCPHCQDEAKDLWIQRWSDPVITYEVIAETDRGKSRWGPYTEHEEAEIMRIEVLARWRGPKAVIYTQRRITRVERIE